MIQKNMRDTVSEQYLAKVGFLRGDNLMIVCFNKINYRGGNK